MIHFTTEKQIDLPSASLLQTLAAALLGLVLLFFVGFAPIDVVHNAAHDSRHSLAFPCH